MADTDKSWCMLYPVYLDKAYSLSKGRRVAQEFALETPTATEMVRAIESLQLPCAIEASKRHSASARNPGRVRFLYKDAAGELINEEVDCKQTLLLLIADIIAQKRKERALTAPTPKGAQAQAQKGKKTR